MPKCSNCQYKRDISLPYRSVFDDIICYHEDTGRESNWIYAGKIVPKDFTAQGEYGRPDWCPLLEKS